MDIEKGTKVKLTVDLTQYAKGLVAGTEGITAGQQGMWSRGSDRFVTVRFPGRSAPASAENTVFICMVISLTGRENCLA